MKAKLFKKIKLKHFTQSLLIALTYDALSLIEVGFSLFRNFVEFIPKFSIFNMEIINIAYAFKHKLAYMKTGTNYGASAFNSHCGTPFKYDFDWAQSVPYRLAGLFLLKTLLSRKNKSMIGTRS